MTAVKNKKAFSLADVMVVMAIIAILAAILMPAAKTLIESFETASQVNPVIGVALANSRALAIKERKYVGIRFQQDLTGDQYMIQIIHDDISTGLANGFRAVQGRKPMKLPEAVGVMDLMVVTRKRNTSGHVVIDELPAVNNGMINEQSELNDTTAFSIVFSPAGRLITHNVWIRNRDGRTDDTSDDDVFNVIDNVEKGIGKFLQDDYWGESGSDDLGYGLENSRKGFVVYKKSRLKEVRFDRRWSDYLSRLKVVYVNPYSGRIISD